MSDTNPSEALARAIAHEQSAWSLVRDRLPGTRNYNTALWRNWLEAIEQSDAAARRAVLPAGAPPAAISTKRAKPVPVLAQLRGFWPQR